MLDILSGTDGVIDGRLIIAELPVTPKPADCDR